MVIWPREEVFKSRQLRGCHVAVHNPSDVAVHSSIDPGPIAWCNHLANNNKGFHDRNLITVKSGDPRKLWESLRRRLHHTSKTILPVYSADKKASKQVCIFLFVGK